MTTTEFNIKRLEYLLALYGISKEQLLSILNDGRKELYTADDINGPEIELSLLKKIDRIFKKGLMFYLDFSDPKTSKDTKILFRENCFRSALTVEDKQIVDSVESLKILLDGYRALTDTSNTEYCLSRSANIRHAPKDAANRCRLKLMPEGMISDRRLLLRAMVEKLADLNVYVFEFSEPWNKREKATIDGFFIKPNVIGLKRQDSCKEIFTLAYEIGHYLLGIENIESLDRIETGLNRTSDEAALWCNDFALSLIADNNADVSERSKQHSEDADQTTDALSSKSYGNLQSLSTKRSANDNKKVLKSMRTVVSSTGHLISPLYLETMQYAFYNGLISEAAFCKHLKISQNKLSKYL